MLEYAERQAKMNLREYKIMYDLEDSHFWFVSKRYFVQEVLNKYKNKIETILDIGSGTGGMTKFISQYGKVIGIENNQLGRRLSTKRGIKVLNGNANKLTFKKESFDLVTLFDVLYHKNIDNEDKTIKECKRVLKTKGLLLITDSALKLLSGNHDKATHGKRRYNLKEIIGIVEKSGFTVLRASYVYLTLFPIAFVKRVIIDKLVNPKDSDVYEIPPLVNRMLLLAIRIESLLFRYIDLPIGTSVILIAQKNTNK